MNPNRESPTEKMVSPTEIARRTIVNEELGRLREDWGGAVSEDYLRGFVEDVVKCVLQNPKTSVDELLIKIKKTGGYWGVVLSEIANDKEIRLMIKRVQLTLQTRFK